MLERISPGRRASDAKKLASFVVPNQEADGWWWDYAMWDYHKPYGTAFSIMTLIRCGNAEIDSTSKDAAR